MNKCDATFKDQLFESKNLGSNFLWSHIFLSNLAFICEIIRIIFPKQLSQGMIGERKATWHHTRSSYAKFISSPSP
jgi:hypothetical protein